jgi:hypothetical protein
MFKRIILQIAWLLGSLLLTTKALSQNETEANAVLATVQTLLDGWREASSGKLEAALHPDFREVTLHLQDGAWNFAVEDRATLIGTMAKIQKGAWDDQLINPEVHVDGPIAVVWSRYKFTVHHTENGVAYAPVHCGIETFQLYKTDAGWKIVNFADTHSDACP